MWIIAADTQPYQNIPFIIQAMGESGLVKVPPTQQPLAFDAEKFEVYADLAKPGKSSR